MELVSTDFGWLLKMNEGRIQRIEVDFRLGVLFCDKSESAFLYVETPCYIRGKGQDTRLMPDTPSTLATALGLVNAEVADVSIQKTGHLIVRLIDGRTLEIEPNEQYEAWQVSSPNDFLLVCSPGGEVAVFQQHGL